MEAHPLSNKEQGVVTISVDGHDVWRILEQDDKVAWMNAFGPVPKKLEFNCKAAWKSWGDAGAQINHNGSIVVRPCMCRFLEKRLAQLYVYRVSANISLSEPIICDDWLKDYVEERDIRMAAQEAELFAREKALEEQRLERERDTKEREREEARRSAEAKEWILKFGSDRLRLALELGLLESSWTVYHEERLEEDFGSGWRWRKDTDRMEGIINPSEQALEAYKKIKARPELRDVELVWVTQFDRYSPDTLSFEAVVASAPWSERVASYRVPRGRFRQSD